MAEEPLASVIHQETDVGFTAKRLGSEGDSQRAISTGTCYGPGAAAELGAAGKVLLQGPTGLCLGGLIHWVSLKQLSEQTDQSSCWPTHTIRRMAHY